ncbi:hypothetical protein A3A14_04610 [Candidatus Daviesbacteria bacterium RIFCSPLOWO2_01_FULL_43_38]|uniref:Glycosyltransferase RgtA/B/C/D-like domain-containing protein n=3 Tax=Candidatus Daviesiibacteriota TaxID=1752718 RepID=A0A1F5K099_9BACT|nr:MAG: Glycosyl transferase family 39 [Candidatus Daviesbacteria bacterium GW2011_GWA1_42_6]KKS70096.1 MAG: Glycosyl transferase family 39 [Candidatus Daviesbacteria bacterium GW2011_GWA2_42_7]OGE34303.1 MAG: hypothetical protein A3E45_04955 [Candidatus Daviesbacteria bacterium RIFCSPHIGHO2_12_FULL_43_11]OGE63813.1 MAG: hypothetical protein A3A14_04610 [Candidatus Daviesbacteria bacterium RIFCSPLOWO2_01_FULL_43_38]OGE69110.1 MAG: hypothetical protein A3J21_00660 [Candidatus Daviesbacteria bact
MNYLIFLIFLLAVAIRFLYFPDNVYFAYDQARDSYTALEILKGDIKLIGPPSFLSDKIFPGPLIFYIYAPIYFLFNNNPEAVSAFFRVFNSFGIILTFLAASVIFNKRVGIIAALLFAFSYEQTQYSLFISHQPLAVIPVLLFYLGLALFLFKKDARGLILSALGWGLAIQLHYGYILLILPLLLILLIYRGDIKIPKFKVILFSLVTLLTTLSTFIVVELKYHPLLSFFSSSSSYVSLYPEETLFIINRFFHDIFIADYRFTPIIAVLGLMLFIAVSITKRDPQKKLLFLSFWFLGGLTPYLLSGVPSYYYSAAASVGLLIDFSYLLNLLIQKNFLVGAILLLLVLANNFSQIITINKTGVNSDMVIQPGMLVSNQKRVLDYIYSQASGQHFSINALTIPLNVNTTWSYLFEWYGRGKYHYLPTYGGDAAEGYKGNLKSVKARSELPDLQFLIIEPTLGIRESFRSNFFREESYFTKIIEEEKFGSITVQKRQKI